MFKMVKAYIFDLWDTLAYLDNKLKFPNHKEMLIKKFENINISKEDRAKCIDITKKQKLYLFDDSREVIIRLKKEGYKVAIISNIYSLSGELAKKELKDFLALFDFIAFSYEFGISKPNLNIFNVTLDKLNVKPEEAVMVGNKIDKDIAPAKELGMRAILIDRARQNLEELI